MKCNQCQMLSINGIACHETGCPNIKKVWDSETETWEVEDYWDDDDIMNEDD
jgi:lipoate synthase